MNKRNGRDQLDGVSLLLAPHRPRPCLLGGLHHIPQGTENFSACFSAIYLVSGSTETEGWGLGSPRCSVFLGAISLRA